MYGLSKELVEKAQKIKLIILDVDGVLTDGKVYYSDKGEELKAFNTQDGFGIKGLITNGMKFAIITGRSSPIVDKRAQELGIQYVYQGALYSKLDAYKDCIAKVGIKDEEVAYMGDDLNDLPPIKVVGLSAAPSNAVDEVLESVDLVTKRAGGYGAVREFCDFILRSQSS